MSVIASAFAAPALSPSSALSIDYRLDVATDASTSDNKSWFGAQQLPALNFPSVHGHDIEQAGATRQNSISGAGNSLGMYYNNYNTHFGTYSAADSVAIINSYCTSRFTNATSRWLVLNEVDASTWNGTSGDAYRTWLVDTINGLHDAGYNNIVLYSPRYLASRTYASTWQALAAKSYIGLETYLDGRTIKNSYNFALSKVQAYYQQYYNSWTSTTSGPGLAASRLFAGEHFSVNTYDPTYYWGANGISGTDWQAAIQIRNIAIHNIPFGGFIGYAWQRNDQATGDDVVDLTNQINYERAYAATLVVQTEVPTWTGNGGTSSWANGFNWTGGLPSTVNAPYPLLASTNPTLAKQTTANFFNTIKFGTIVTLDGNQSVTRLAFDSTVAYSIAPGTGGTLSLTGSGASVEVKSGTHTVTAPFTVASALATTFTGNLSLANTFTNGGYTITKNGAGVLRIAGTQNNATNSSIVINAGKLQLDSDAGSTASAQLSIQVGNAGVVGASAQLNATQHLRKLDIRAGNTAAVGAGGNKMLHVGTLSVGANAALDLNDADLIVDTGTFSTLYNLVLGGYRDSADTTATGIISTTGQTTPGNPILALFDNVQLRATNWPFGGTETAGAAAILGKYTYLGDADLNGMVTPDDYGAIDSNLGSHVGTALQSGGMNWFAGDWNLDGDITPDDYSGVDANLGRGENNPLATHGMIAQGAAAVPEPAVLSIFLVTPLFIRRRRI
ncbi:MAG TPA: hypothetical protein VF669_11705 [Tepidisphaeraceae bacterium]